MSFPSVLECTASDFLNCFNFTYPGILITLHSVITGLQGSFFTLPAFILENFQLSQVATILYILNWLNFCDMFLYSAMKDYKFLNVTNFVFRHNILYVHDYL